MFRKRKSFVSRRNKSAPMHDGKARDPSVRLNIANANYLQAHKDVVARYMKAYRETVNYMYTELPSTSMIWCVLKL